MKTVYAPHTVNAYADAARNLILAQPVIAYAALVIALAIAARWLAARF